jgi:hypothetical protein
MAKDDELLQLLADANFREFFIGIESSNKESLKEAKKLQNYHSNLVSDALKIQSYGVPIRGALIVGFDNDDKNIFDQHIKFTQDANLPVPSVRILMASPGTRLWRRMRKEGRLLKTERDGRFFGNAGTTNIIPKNMTRIELQEGFLALRERVYSWEEFAIRIKKFVSNVKRRPNVPKLSFDWNVLAQFTCFLFSSRIDWKARRVIVGILWHTVKQAPFMMARVSKIIMRLFGYANTKEMREVAQKQIDMEKSGELKWEIEQNDTLVPEGFREPYEEIFPEVCKEVDQGLTDKAYIGETLIEIFTNFLRHWEPASESFSAEHRGYIMELTRLTILEKNGMNGDRSSEVPSSFTNMNELDVKRARLSEDILRAVEQELLMGGCERA